MTDLSFNGVYSFIQKPGTLKLPDIRVMIRTDNICYLFGSFVECIHFNVNCQTGSKLMGFHVPLLPILRNFG